MTGEERLRERVELQAKAAALRTIIYDDKATPEAIELAKLDLSELGKQLYALDPPAADPWETFDAAAYEARSARQREADLALSEKRRELSARLVKLNADPAASPGAREAIEKELHDLRYPKSEEAKP